MAESIRALEIALDAMPVAVSWASLRNYRVLYMNRAFRQTFGYTLADVSTVGDCIAALPEETDRILVGKRWSALLAKFDGSSEAHMQETEIAVRCKDGTVKTVLNGCVLLPGAKWALATFVDISERKRDEVRLREAEQRARGQQVLQAMLLEHSQEMIVISPKDSRRRAVSPGVFHITGYTPEEYLSLTVEALNHPDDYPRSKAAIERALNGGAPQTVEARIRRKDASWRWIECRLCPYTDPETAEVLGYVASMLDISERKAREAQLSADNERLQQLSEVDELTGLANRRGFNQAFAREASRHTRAEQDLTLLLIDIDSFKDYNDHYGHLEGDACLRELAATMRAILGRASDMIARFGGEEFIVLLPLTDRRGAEKLANSLLAAVRAMKRPHPTSPYKVVTASIGVACWPTDLAVDQQRFINEADIALYAAKHAGRNTVRFADI